MEDQDFASRLAAALDCDKETVGDFIKGETSLVSSLFAVDRKEGDQEEKKLNADSADLEGKADIGANGAPSSAPASDAAGQPTRPTSTKANFRIFLIS